MSNIRFGRMRARCACIALFIGGMMSVPVHADMIQISADLENRVTSRGSFEGVIEYDYDSESDTGRLLITLTNLNSPDDRGYLTAFAFNIASSDPDAFAQFVSGPFKFLDAANRNVQAFGGQFDAGAGLKGKFHGGGNPIKGIAPGDTESFEFVVSASDAAFLTAASFINGPFDHNLVVKFRGFQPGGMDIVPVQAFNIPGPSALAMLAIVAAMSGWRRRTATNRMQQHS